MKNTLKLFGIIAMVAVVVSLTSCASLFGAPAWDKSVSKDQTATLVFDEDIEINGVDGMVKTTGMSAPSAPSGGAVSLVWSAKGKGSEKKPKGKLSIPAGEHVISARNVRHSDSKGFNESPKFNFEAGRTYQLKLKQEDISAGNTSFAEAAADIRQAMKGEIPVIFEFVDVTK